MNKNDRKLKRQLRTRKDLKGTGIRPRLSVFRSNNYIYAQLINDEKGETMLGVTEKHLEKKVKETRVNTAKQLGVTLAKKALDKKIKSVIFDRGSYAYHGRIKALAEGAREGGLIF